ncbi:MAG TPA: aminotransferase class IV [Pyrinomonadaceae bacterium]|nr:aminotransferase class IV [Pyrinomonadaceae bacterium]
MYPLCRRRREIEAVHPYVIHNESLLEETKVRLPPVTAATLHGRGVFTVAAIHGGRPFLWPQHWARLAEHADRAGVGRKGFDEASVGALVARVIEANRVETGQARVMLLGRSVRGAWRARGGAQHPTDLLIITADARNVSGAGLALTVSPFRINTHSPLAGVKSINYLEHTLAWEEARARDFDEAVVLNERGEVASATTANLFWVTHGTLHTPALTTGAVAGVTRARLVELAGEMALPFVESASDLAHVGDADEIFLTSSTLGVAIVTSFDFHRYTVAAGSVALRLREAFRQLTLEPE